VADMSERGKSERGGRPYYVATERLSEGCDREVPVHFCDGLDRTESAPCLCPCHDAAASAEKEER